MAPTKAMARYAVITLSLPANVMPLLPRILAPKNPALEDAPLEQAPAARAPNQHG
ncbi:hypothetical protein ACVIWV_000765 [Bradyrhizobium diazoefficiens]